MLAEKRLEELGIELPESSEAKAMYVPVKRFGNLLFISGQIPTVGSEAPYTGKVGGSLSLEQAQEAARLCTINMLAAVRHETGDLDRVKNVIKLQAFVSSAPGFDKQHIVVNAASQLLFDVFGERGRHARTAVGTSQLPLDMPVEVEAIFEVE